MPQIDNYANYDEPWKEALSEYFEDFLNFFFPQVYQLIDWGQTPQSLDKELQQITSSSTTEKRLADKLYQVWLLNQQPVWILIHIEIQSQYETDFAQRMYIYNYRAFDLYHQPVISLAVLGDERKNWRPNSYNYEMGGCRLSLEFPVAKLLDYEKDWQAVESNNNPFAFIVMAHLKTKATTNNPPGREEWKWKLVRGLYERGLGRKQIVKLFQIIDKMMTLPEQLQEKLNNKIKEYEGERTMPLLSNLEERAIEHGKEIGALENIRDNIKTILQVRFVTISSDIEDLINQMYNLSILEEILKLAVTINSLEEFKQSLESVAISPQNNASDR